ncbi:MAG TPA: poly(3-hydroxyalkanoate) depolymerase [Myxococcales bacterium]|nr:poly(3-hydroxyalkanoate) depolymerase [Myxococcales bacterium]
MHDRSHAFSIQMVRAGGQLLRAARRAGRGPPLLMFNGIGANIELLEPFARQLEREIVTFDVPGVGHSPLGTPYRLPGLARLAAQVLEHFGHRRADVLGVSWGGAVAQQFARSEPARCRRLVLCATATGAFMIPGSPAALIKLATPLRYLSTEYAVRVAGDIYGGDFRRDPSLAREVFRSTRWQSWLGYYLQLAAAAGWTSIHWLHRIEQPTLVMAGVDDPIVPPANARLMCRLIPNAELKMLDCGHLFLLTRAEESARAIDEFLGKAPMEVEQ